MYNVHYSMIFYLKNVMILGGKREQIFAWPSLDSTPSLSEEE